jgi:antitoxin component YwqK of YwqJK toxin-antitoxin module
MIPMRSFLIFLVVITFLIPIVLVGCDSTPTQKPSDMFRTGDSLMSAGKVQDAIKIVEAALKIDSSEYRGWYLLGEAYHSLDDCDAALRYYLRAERLNRKDIFIQRNQGICLLALGNHEKAYDKFTGVLTSPGRVIQDYYYRASCAMKLKLPDEAYNDIMAAMEIDTAHVYDDRFMGFIYENFSEDYLSARFYADKGMTVEYSFNGDSVKHGKWSSYFADGKLYEQGNFTNGIKQGPERVYFDSAGNMQSEVPYVAGKMHGTRLTRYEDGTVWSEVTYVDDLRSGIARSFYPNGAAQKLENYSGGKKDGLQYEFMENGQVAIRAEFSQGIEHGNVFYYDGTEQLYVKLLFDNGTKLETEPLDDLFDPATLLPPA